MLVFRSFFLFFAYISPVSIQTSICFLDVRVYTCRALDSSIMYFFDRDKYKGMDMHIGYDANIEGLFFSSNDNNGCYDNKEHHL